MTQLKLQDFGVSETVKTSDVNVTLFISDYDGLAQETQELKTVFSVDITDDGRFDVEVAGKPDQEGAAAHYIANNAGQDLGTFDDYDDAKDAMRQFFYKFFSSGKTQMGADQYGAVVETQTSGTETPQEQDEEVLDEKQKLVNALQSFINKLRNRKGFYTQRINQEREGIQESESEIDTFQQEISELREDKNNLIEQAAEAQEDGRTSEASSLYGQAGALETNQINPLEGFVDEEKQEIANHQRAIQRLRDTRSQVDDKIEEVQDRLDDIQ